MRIDKDTRETKVGWIPMDWDCPAMAELGEISSGGTPDTTNPDYWEGKVPWVTPSDITALKTRFITDTRTKITELGLRKSSAVLLPVNTVVVCTRATIGRCAVAKIALATNQGFKNITGLTASCAEYLYYQILFFKNALLRLGCGSTYLEVSKSDFSRLHIPFPKCDEELRRIVEILSAWDDAIDQTRMLIDAKKRLRKALMQQLLTGKRRLPGFIEPWNETQLDQIFRREQRPTELVQGHEYRLVSIRRRAGGLFERGHFVVGDIAYSELHHIEANDLLISKRQVTHGALAVVGDGFAGAYVSNEYTILSRKEAATLYMPFFRWLTHSRWLWHLAYISSDGVHIEKLIFKPRSFLRHSLSLPRSIHEQEAIATILQTADEEIQLLEMELVALNKQMCGLMQKLLTGTIRVKA
jgi:type I restriction enzyme S subunit